MQAWLSSAGAAVGAALFIRLGQAGIWLHRRSVGAGVKYGVQPLLNKAIDHE